jgi:hypothetical protein
VAGSGRKNSRWKGGSYINSCGYRMVLAPDHPAAWSNGYAPEHRKNYFDFHGDLPEPWESIHHWDGDKLHNDPSNLQPMLTTDHARLTRKNQIARGINYTKGDPRAKKFGKRGGIKAAKNARRRKLEAERQARKSAARASKIRRLSKKAVR